jgi:HEAT repeat protein
MIGRLTAVNELRTFSSDESTQALWIRIATHDAFWAVRQAALENAGKYSGLKSVELFKTCLNDENSKVRLSAIRLLGDLKDPKMNKLFVKMFESENSYAVKAELLRSIGKCGDRQQLSFLRAAESEKSYRNVVGKAANEAIAMIMKKQK